MKKLLVLCGLPGSGKTTFAQKLMFEKNAYYFDGDAVVTENQNLQDFLLKIKCVYEESINNQRDLILDGLFLTNEDYLRLTEYFSEYPLEFHFWQENRQLCLENDYGRREKNAAVTIKYAPLEKPLEETFKKINNLVEVVEHQIIRKAGNAK